MAMIKHLWENPDDKKVKRFWHSFSFQQVKHNGHMPIYLVNKEDCEHYIMVKCSLLKGVFYMPRGDRKGPQRQGSKTGRGQDACTSGKVDQGSGQGSGQGRGSGRVQAKPPAVVKERVVALGIAGAIDGKR